MKIKSSIIGTHKVDKDTSINSFLFAYMISYNAIAVLVHYFFPIIPAPGYFIGIIPLAVLFYKKIKNPVVKINRAPMIFIAFLLLFFCVSIILYMQEHTFELLLKFMFFGIISLIISLNNIDIKKTLDIPCNMMLIFFVPAYRLLSINLTTALTLTMGYSYALLPISCAVLLHFLIYHEFKIIRIIEYLEAAILLFSVITKGVRGCTVTLAGFLVLYWFLTMERRCKGNNKLAIRMLLVLVGILVVGIVYVNLGVIIDSISGSSLSNHLYFITKTLRAIEVGDISNGRNAIYSIAWDYFLIKPLIGNGIGTFSLATNGTQEFAHNIFFQLLYEGGMLLTIPVMVLLFMGIKSVYLNTKECYEIRFFYTYLLSLGLIPVLFSNEFWITQLFWLMIGYYFSKRKR